MAYSLLLSELLFSLPFTTSAVERAFSKLKIIKTDRRCSLHTSTLDDLMEINIEGPTFENFSSSASVDLWWADRIRRPNQSSSVRPSSSVPDSEDQGTSTDSISLDRWDELFD